MTTVSKQVIYIPENFKRESSGNAYTEQMVDCWMQLGYRPAELPRGRQQQRQALRQRRNTVGVVNWVDNCLIGREGRFSWRGLKVFLVTTLKLRMFCRKVIFVRHNVYPHAARGKSKTIAKLLIDFSESLLFNDVFVHSKHYLGRSRTYVPHPAYRFNEVPLSAVPSDDVVYFGSVVPYKHLERLIAAWNRTSRLVIAGGCGNPAYLVSLKDLARGKNIEFNCGRISDEDAQRLLRGAAAAVIPHAGSDMIVSGSLYFALSCGVPVICCGLQHARQLEQEDMPGVICLDRPEDINVIDTARLQRMDRHEIASAVHARFGTEAVARSISQVL